jgi:hypothetical protein
MRTMTYFEAFYIPFFFSMLVYQRDLFVNNSIYITTLYHHDEEWK